MARVTNFFLGKGKLCG